MLVGVIGWITTSSGSDGTDPEPIVVADVPPTAPPATTGATPSTSAPETAGASGTSATAPAVATSPSTVAVSTSTSTTTTTAPAPDPALAVRFVEEFAGAIARGDDGFLFDRLHPVVLELYTVEACRAAIDEQILAMEDYRVRGPGWVETQTFTVGAGRVDYEVVQLPVSFVFQGQPFDAEASFAAVDGEMRWFTRCE